MDVSLFLCVVAIFALVHGTKGELLQNGGFESLDHWSCGGYRCELITSNETRFGSNSLRTVGRTKWYQGPQQVIQTTPGKTYRAQSWAKILNDLPGKLGQTMQLEASFAFADGSHDYINAGWWPMLRTADGWVFLQGDFQAPSKPATEARFYFQGPDPGVDYAVDQASVTEVTPDPNWRNETDAVIDQVRKSDINFRVTAAGGIDKSEVQIQVVQTRKSFPFGTEVNSWRYVDPAQQKYRDFLQQHFNWAVLGNALKWRQLEWNYGHRNYDRALKSVNGLRAQGLKVRGHNMVWSVEAYIPTWVKTQSGDQLRETAYLAQAQKTKAANVGLYGLGIQTHFHKEQEPNPTLMK
ncbi:hypothetical protein BaRGS_00005993, partial [Batillaria attramentaria]